MKHMVTFPSVMTLQSALLGTIMPVEHWARGLLLHALWAVPLIDYVKCLTRLEATPPSRVSVRCDLLKRLGNTCSCCSSLNVCLSLLVLYPELHYECAVLTT